LAVASWGIGLEQGEGAHLEFSTEGAVLEGGNNSQIDIATN
jgi:hypothetical protein